MERPYKEREFRKLGARGGFKVYGKISNDAEREDDVVVWDS